MLSVLSLSVTFMFLPLRRMSEVEMKVDENPSAFFRPTSVTNCDFLDDLMYSRVEAKLLQEMCLCCLKTCWSAADTWKQPSLCLVSH